MIEALAARDAAAHARGPADHHLNHKRDVVLEQLRGVAGPAAGTAAMNAPLP